MRTHEFWLTDEDVRLLIKALDKYAMSTFITQDEWRKRFKMLAEDFQDAVDAPTKSPSY